MLKKSSKRFVSIVMAIAMILTMVPFAAFADETTASDLSGHWAENVITEWMDYGIINGYEDGTIRPNNKITRAEMTAMLDRVMDYQTKADNTFSDLGDSWYTDVILKANAAGVISGYPDGTVKPDATITRQEAVAMFSRVLSLDTKNAPEATFTDNADVADWAKDAVNAMAAADYIHGSDGQFRPNDGITRAEVVTILNNIFDKLYQKAGEYTGDVDGSAVVSADGVTLKDMTISGDLIIAEGVGDGHVVLDNVTVDGKLIVRGGGENSVIIKGDSKIDNISVERIDGAVRVAVEDDASVNAVLIDNGGQDVKLEGTVDTVNVVAANANVDITGTAKDINVADTAKNATITVTKTATADNVSTSAENTTIIVAGTVSNIDIADTASNSVVTTQSSATIDKVTTAAGSTTVEGSGTVSDVVVGENASDATVTTEGTKVENNSNSDVTTGDDSVIAPGTTDTTPGGTTETPSVPSTPSTPHSHNYIYVDNGDGTHTGVCSTDNDTITEKHDTNGENGGCSKCNTTQTATSVASVKNANGDIKYYNDLKTAMQDVEGDSTVTLLTSAIMNMDESSYIITNKTITLNLNGNTVTWTSSAKNMIEIGTNGGLTIQDATNTGMLYFKGTGATSYGSGITTSGNGNLSLTGGTVLYEHDKSGYGLNVTGNSTFIMTGGTVKIAGAVDYAVRLASTSQCQLNGGQILFDANSTANTLYGVYAVLFSTAGEAAGFSLGNLTVDGSMLPDTKTVYCVYGYNSNTSITISGGTYTANAKSASYAVGGGSSNNTAISGGTFNGAVKAAIGKVTGGLFSEQPSAAYLPEGKIYELQQDGCYHVVDGTYVARLGTVGYTSWEELFKDASTTATASAVYILADVDEITVPEDKNVILYNSGNCTIGKITNNGTCKIISYAMTGTEVVNNGTLNLGHEVKSIVNNPGATMDATSYSFAKVTDSITNNSTMTISQGTYPCTITNKGTLTLQGGKFSQNVTDLCAEGYTTQKSDDLWVVVKDGPHVAEIDGYWYTSLSAAINAAQDGDTVKLLTDITLTPTTFGTGLKSTITISGTTKPNLTLDLNGKTISWDQSKADQKLTSTPVMFTVLGGAHVTITGNGTIDTALGSNASYGVNMTTSTANQLTIKNGTFKGAPTAVQVEKGTLTILGGTFELAQAVDNSEQAKYVVNAIDANWKDATANISIQGGSFCFNPADNPEGTGTSYVANGYHVTEDNGIYTVSKE